MRFTQEPSNPSYFDNGSDANLVWDYTDPLNKVQGTLFSVLIKGTFHYELKTHENLVK